MQISSILDRYTGMQYTVHGDSSLIGSQLWEDFYYIV